MRRHSFSEDEKAWVFDKTSGHCYWCDKQLVFKNHGKRGSRGAWHIDHKYPLARGGSDEPHNWIPACISCNIDKSALRPGEWTGMEIPLGPLDYSLTKSPKWLK